MLIIGAIVYINLGISHLKFAEHSAIYLGNNRFVELNGDGIIKLIDSWTLLNSSKQRTGDKIFIATDGFGFPLQNKDIAIRALKKVGTQWNYQLLENNCHEFIAGCIINKFENEFNYFFMLKQLISENLNNNQPIQWKIFKPIKKTIEEEQWINNFFSSFLLFLKLTHIENKKDIKKIFKVSNLSNVLKKANKNQGEFLKIFKKILKDEWNNKKYN